MPKVFFKDANLILSDVIGEFETTDDYLTADAIVCWNDIEGECRDIILSANFLGKPTLVMQHGLRAIREYLPPFNAPLISEKIMVWGPRDKERILESSVANKRIFVTGTTLFDHLIPRQSHDGVNVVFSPMHWDTDLDENNVLADKLREITGINVITKLIDGMDGSHFDNTIYSNRTSKDHLDICASVLSTADLVVGINESTFEFLAYKLDIPVVIVDLWKPKYFNNRLFFSEISSFFSNACPRVDLADLQKTISDTLSNPGQFSLERRKALQEEAGIDLDDGLTARQRIVQIIEDTIIEGQTRLKQQSHIAIIEHASRMLNDQMKFKESKTQQELGNISYNLQEVRDANRQYNHRHSRRQNDSISINILDYPICFSYPLRLDMTSAWIEHIPFGMFIIDLLRPKVLVELGTHTGVSYNAFCQAVKHLGLDTRCYAVDTWEGDEHAGYYGPEILEDLREYHDPLYGHFSRLMQSTFDNAVGYFSDGTIDLLHIDGLHTYEAAKHDFETWLPKLSSKGVVLFHDTNVRERGFGIWKLWEEITQDHPSFEFYHGNGFGVLGIGNDLPPMMTAIFANKDPKPFREFFAGLGKQNNISVELSIIKAQAAESDQSIQQLQADVAEREQTVQNLNAQLAEREQSIQQLQADVAEREQTVQNLKAQLADRDQSIQQLQADVAEREQTVQNLNAQLTEREQSIQQLQADVAEREQTVQNLNAQLAERDQTIQQLNADVAEREQSIQQLQADVAEREQEVLFYALSKSWRITRPLRKFMKLIRGKRND